MLQPRLLVKLGRTSTACGLREVVSERWLIVKSARKHLSRCFQPDVAPGFRLTPVYNAASANVAVLRQRRDRTILGALSQMRSGSSASLNVSVEQQCLAKAAGYQRKTALGIGEHHSMAGRCVVCAAGGGNSERAADIRRMKSFRQLRIARWFSGSFGWGRFVVE